MKKACIFLLVLAIFIPLVPCDEEDLGLPFYESDAEIVRHTGFVLKYSEEHEQAEWVAYLLTLSEVEAEDFQRTDNFRVDPQVLTRSATLDGYRGSGLRPGALRTCGRFQVVRRRHERYLLHEQYEPAKSELQPRRMEEA